MIRQNTGDSRRKLLETKSLHFVIFFDDDNRIVGFDLEDYDYTHLYQWRRGKRPEFYGVANIGKSYHNRDEVFLNGRFPAAEVAAELGACGQNIRGEVCAVLLEGINAHT